MAEQFLLQKGLQRAARHEVQWCYIQGKERAQFLSAWRHIKTSISSYHPL